MNRWLDSLRSILALARLSRLTRIPQGIRLLFSVLLVALLSLALMRLAGTPDVRISDATIQPENQAEQHQPLPWQQEIHGHFSVRINLIDVRSSSVRLRIYPDDELLGMTLNGTPLSLEKVSAEDRKAWANGFVYTVQGLRPGETNVLEFKLVNANGPGGLNVRTELTAPAYKFVLAYLLLMALVIVLMRHLPITRMQFVLLALSLLLSLLYLSVTDSHTRTFDVYEGGGHLDYINYILQQHSLPDPGQGWEYHQPPLYYTLAALAKRAAGNIMPGEFWGQLFALELWTIFLTSGLAAMRAGLRHAPRALLIASLALALWPAGIIHSIRLGNDAALFAFYGLSFFFVTRWWLQRQRGDLWAASLWMTAAIISKSSGFALAGALLALVAAEAWPRRHRTGTGRRLLVHGSIVCACLFAGFAINLGDNIVDYLRGTASDWLLSNVANVINGGLRVSNSPEKYVIFDLATFLQQPFVSTWEDQYGRQYFWNFLLRSALSSEFFFSGSVLRSWGVVNGVLLLLALLTTPVYLLQRLAVSPARRVILRSWRHLPWLLSGALLLGLLLAYRIKVPYASNGDFRYIYPALLSLLYLTALPWRQPRRFPIATVLALTPALIGVATLVWLATLIGQ